MGSVRSLLSRACGSCVVYWKLLLSMVSRVHGMGSVVWAGRYVVRVKSARTFVDDGFGPHAGNRVMPSRQRRSSRVNLPGGHMRMKDVTFVDSCYGVAKSGGSGTCKTSTPIRAGPDLAPTH
ncbi:hypothetical protein B0H11DRAFT_1990260 [Mycena galericulata]|nr:hypothetical protein B0H11DRAFT_1990260 [Mycena galericulata]